MYISPFLRRHSSFMWSLQATITAWFAQWLNAGVGTAHKSSARSMDGVVQALNYWTWFGRKFADLGSWESCNHTRYTTILMESTRLPKSQISSSICEVTTAQMVLMCLITCLKPTWFRPQARLKWTLNSKPLSRLVSQTNCGSLNQESQAIEVMAFECSIIMKK